MSYYYSVDHRFYCTPHCTVGCVAGVGNESGLMYTQPLGSFTYGDPDPVSHTNPPMKADVSVAAECMADIIHTFAFPSSTLIMTPTSHLVWFLVHIVNSNTTNNHTLALFVALPQSVCDKHSSMQFWI